MPVAQSVGLRAEFARLGSVVDEAIAAWRAIV